ncbi:YheC/YheD family protein [Neobacillus sp. 179-C4.2 HS]|uniref:YheC/YheD family protein n=1 Tax=Neobacillus driksii TaxID=3035913 RepID=A0ABV4YX63_9BACI|nr:YheC/YheD family protein [Neobacillus sp. 179.-C4.2 HS]MDP5196536.1 YheC/YheD family protein [Neobacillus sp. 179.-C4.2 HS]
MVVTNPWSNGSTPVIGILTARKKDGSIAGNGALFIELQKKLISLNGISFIFTLDGVHQDSIDGYLYIPERNDWERISSPFPDLVYNRIPFRRTEEELKSSMFFACLKEMNIPFFNPGFIDKSELYNLFKKHPFLHTFLPATIPAKNKQKLSAFLSQYQSIYLKPSQSARGNGIFKLELDTAHRVLLKGLNENDEFVTFDSFWKEWERRLVEKNYLAQEEIKPVLYEGKRFDFRILAHAEKNHYKVTGIGIRQSQKQDITTHVPSGGRLLPYEQLQNEEYDFFIETIVQHIGASLTEAFGFFGEFSIDMGISQSGQFYIYEVNSKPMSFDETEIEEKRIEHLCQLFQQLTAPKKD